MDSAPQLKDGHSRGCYIMWACCGGLNMFTHSLQFLPPRHRVYFPNPWTWTDHVTGFAQKNTLNAAPRDFQARPQKKVFLEDLSLLASPLVLFGCSHHHVKELHPAHWRMRGLWKRSWVPWLTAPGSCQVWVRPPGVNQSRADLPTPQGQRPALPAVPQLHCDPRTR